MSRAVNPLIGTSDGGFRERLENGQVTEAQIGNIFLYTGSGGCQSGTDWSRYDILVHAYFHIVQSELYPYDVREPPAQVRTFGPCWLVEGSAVYVSYAAAAYSRMPSLFQGALAAAKQSTKASPVALDSLETCNDFGATDASYDIGFVAVDFLIAGLGEPSLITFWDGIGHGATWEVAFERAFGRTVQEFYSDFEAYRKTL